MSEEVPSFDRAIRTAYRLLAVRARSDWEIRLRLREKGFDNTLVEAVVARLHELGYLDDRDFARQWSRQLAVNRLYGDSRIEAGLREKGISRTLIHEAIARTREELTERQAAAKLLKRYLGGKSDVELGRKEKERIARRLMGKGFSTALIFEILKRTEEESVHDDDGE